MKFDGIQIFRVVLLVSFIVLSTIFIFIPWFRADNLFLTSAYNDKIKKIEIRSGHRGNAHILVDTTWRLLVVDELKIQAYIQPGDSIVKQRGVRTITVFRQTDNGAISKRFN
jgi:hypothetical protein